MVGKRVRDSISLDSTNHDDTSECARTRGDATHRRHKERANEEGERKGEEHHVHIVALTARFTKKGQEAVITTGRHMPAAAKVIPVVVVMPRRRRLG